MEVVEDARGCGGEAAEEGDPCSEKGKGRMEGRGWVVVVMVVLVVVVVPVVPVEATCCNVRVDACLTAAVVAAVVVLLLLLVTVVTSAGGAVRM